MHSLRVCLEEWIIMQGKKYEKPLYLTRKLKIMISSSILPLRDTLLVANEIICIHTPPTRV